MSEAFRHGERTFERGARERPRPRGVPAELLLEIDDGEMVSPNKRVLHLELLIQAASLPIIVQRLWEYICQGIAQGIATICRQLAFRLK